MLIVAYPRDETFLARAPFPLQIERKLLEMDRLLEDPKLVLAVSNDLLDSAPQAAWNGRPATPVVVTLRCAVARALMGWSYATAHDEIDGSVKWRWFCHIYSHAVPNHSTLRDREALIRPTTVQRLHRRSVQRAQVEGVTQGKKLRTDGTVIETNIHYPTDSQLLSDSVRVLGRLLSHARKFLAPQTPAEKKPFRNRSRRARQLARKIAYTTRRQKGQKQTINVAQRPYRQLVQVTQQTLTQVEQVIVQLQPHPARPAAPLVATFQHYLPLVRQVIAQTTRRVFEKKQVPAPQKIVSLFEPHTAIIQRGKHPPQETEFGHKLWYSEVEGGIISEYRILQGNPSDDQHWVASLQQHQTLFGHPPELATGDRGVHSVENERVARAMGVKQVALPQPGVKTKRRQRYEQQKWFKAALRFRNGIEGRISGLKRARHLDRCLNRGADGLARWVGWRILTNNLVVIATKLARRKRRVKAET
jgi:transposase, IS5 family